ncbi:MAG TPA: twin-arginine translocation signal domain-containing protein [Acidimicrobiales bacterium]|jgi:hypothetical protein|nr:twin-arginine translocation signal domain-containing protein [Acidimicrobiales bacterium]
MQFRSQRQVVPGVPPSPAEAAPVVAHAAVVSRRAVLKAAGGATLAGMTAALCMHISDVQRRPRNPRLAPSEMP